MNDFSFGRKIKFDTSGNPIINANILPSTTLSYDLGSSDKRWRDIYLSGNTIDLDGALIQKEIGGGIKIADASGNTLDGKFNNIDISGNAIINGNATINGIINQAIQLDVSGSILPTRNLVYDLGSPDKRWNDLYLSGNTIDLSGTLLSRHTDGSLMVHDSNSNMVNLRANNIIADGNLTVSGTTTTINSTTVTVQDPIITLGSDITNTKDKGIEFKYGTGKIGFFGYDDSTGNFSFLKDASNNNEVFSGTQGTLEGLTFKSTVVSGTAPLTVTSSTLVTNLNADLLDGLNSDKFMRTDANTSTTGNVGIGIASPATKLQVQSTSITTGLSIQNADVHTILGNTAGVTNSGSIQVKAAGSSSTIGTTNYNLCLNPDGGNVGIGIDNPTAKLHVNGDINYTSNLLRKGKTPPFVRYESTVSRSAPGNVQFVNPIYDTHSAASKPGTSWRYTVPTGCSGYYHVSIGLYVNGGNCFATLVENAVETLMARFFETTDVGTQIGSTVLKLTSGNYYEVRLESGTIASPGNPYSFISISCLQLLD